MNIKASIIGYEDSYDEDHVAVTYYEIKLTNVLTNQSYVIKKRYSDFAKLHEFLKLRFYELDQFKFPNKSILNTHSKFTKERRLRGFDDYIKILVQLKELPEVREFLEIHDLVLSQEGSTNHGRSQRMSRHRLSRDRISRNRLSRDRILSSDQISSSSSGAYNRHTYHPPLTGLSSASTEHVINSLRSRSQEELKDESMTWHDISTHNTTTTSNLHTNRNLPSQEDVSSEDNISMSPPVTFYERIRQLSTDIVGDDEEDILNQSIYFCLYLLPTSIFIVVCIYMICYWLHMIDITKTTRGRIILTWLISGLGLSLTRIYWRPKEVR